MSSPTLFTVGHSTRSLEEFLELLVVHRITRIVDVRRFPGSRRHPHFGKDALARALTEGGIAYEHAEELGGRRSGDPAAAARSPNRAWRNAQFRAYADHMSSAEFTTALARVLDGAVHASTAVMCAESVPWRCHRQLIADAVVARGWRVLHVVGAEPARPHALNPAARVGADMAVTYPSVEESQSELF